MGMSDAVWDRHANPWSGWSRMAIPALFAIAIWSRTWIGWWSVVLISVLVAWTWWNPRAFPVPASHESWMTRGVLGERIWLDRNRIPIPEHHRRMAFILAGASGFGVLPYAWGVWNFDIWAVIAGLVLIVGGKLWFLDRMNWLFQQTTTEAND